MRQQQSKTEKGPDESQLLCVTALSSLAEKLWKTAATCAVMVVVCFLERSQKRNRVSEIETSLCLLQRHCDGDQQGTGVSEAPANAGRGQRPQTRPNLSMVVFHVAVATPVSAVCSSGGT